MEHTQEHRRSGLSAGCSAVSWSTCDGRHLWGRNFEFDRIARGSMVTFLPRGTDYPTRSSPDGSHRGSLHTARFSCAGTGLLLPGTGPILYDGINEQGLMGGQLYYRGFARYERTVRPGTSPLQPPFLVFHVLAQCATVDEAAALLGASTLVDEPLLGAVPPLHWSFTDRTGETMVVEPDEDGLHIYRNTLGVMTNSPGYPWHRLNLLNYAAIRPLDHDTVAVEGTGLTQCFSGSGAQGLPGDWSSPSRFVRLAFLRTHCVKGKTEQEGVPRLFRMLQSAAFPLGMVAVSQPDGTGELDDGVLPFDYTVYTCAACAESGRYYWTSYDDPGVRYVELDRLAAHDHPVRFPLDEPAPPRCLSP